MLKDLWNLLSRSETLLDEARRDAIAMLEMAEDMFELVLKAMVEEAHADCVDRISRMDQMLNVQQQGIRKKVFEHLAVSRGSDLLMGLVLTSVVIDLERIGDYTKNIGEMVCLLPAKMDFGPYAERYESVVSRTRALFEKTRTAFESSDPEAARNHARVLPRYQERHRRHAPGGGPNRRAPGDRREVGARDGVPAALPEARRGAPEEHLHRGQQPLPGHRLPATGVTVSPSGVGSDPYGSPSSAGRVS
jgi:hypothetical protein